MTEFVWINEDYASYFPTKPIPPSLLPSLKGNKLFLGSASKNLITMQDHELFLYLPSIEKLKEKDSDFFDLIISGNICEVPPSYANSNMGIGSGIEVLREITRTLKPGGLAFIKVWHPFIYVLMHHAEVIGSIEEALSYPKVLMDLAISLFSSMFKRIEARNDFEKLLPDKLEVLSWYPSPSCAGKVFLDNIEKNLIKTNSYKQNIYNYIKIPQVFASFSPHLKAIKEKHHELTTRFLPHYLFSNAIIVVRKRWPRINEKGEWT